MKKTTVFYKNNLYGCCNNYIVNAYDSESYKIFMALDNNAPFSFRTCFKIYTTTIHGLLSDFINELNNRQILKLRLWNFNLIHKKSPTST